MVELACATTMVPGYSKELFDRLVPVKTSGEPRNVIFIVCGGFKVSVAELMEYTKIAAAETSSHWEVLCNGEQWSLLKQ
jgi:L-serine/L-threonine ammonia-lyase